MHQVLFLFWRVTLILRTHKGIRNITNRMVGRHFVKIQNASVFIFSRRLDIFMFSTPRKHRDIEKENIFSYLLDKKTREIFYILTHKRSTCRSCYVRNGCLCKVWRYQKEQALTINLRKRIPKRQGQKYKQWSIKHCKTKEL